jgi:hypothetical protein
MSGRIVSVVLSATLLPAALGWASTLRPAETLLWQASSSSSTVPSVATSGWTEPPPSGAEIAARAQKLVANQHKDDEALTEFERIERHMDLTAGPNPRTIQDRVYRTVPTGTGTLKILLKDNGAKTDPAEYRRQLQDWEDVLQLTLRPSDPRTKTAYEKFNRRNRQRGELLDAMVDSFSANWLGRETLNNRPCDVFELTPKSDFHPRSMIEEALSHVVAKIWVDNASDQMVRGEARITRDISFGGGILGKVYRGSVFSMEQSEVAPGIWEPARYQYDFEGRKFLFSFDVHQVIEASRYRRVGAPKEALVVVENELAQATPMIAEP